MALNGTEWHRGPLVREGLSVFQIVRNRRILGVVKWVYAWQAHVSGAADSTLTPLFLWFPMLYAEIDCARRVASWQVLG